MKPEIQRFPVSVGRFARRERPKPIFPVQNATPGQPVLQSLSCARLKSRTKVSMKLLLRTHASE
jgi:hypothetical protein